MQRVLIIENELLLGAGIQVLLAAEVDLDVIGIAAIDEERLAQELSRLRPDVIILDETSRLACPDKLQVLLNGTSQVQIVVISASHDLIRIYNKREIRLYQTTDFLDIIRENSFSDEIS